MPAAIILKGKNINMTIDNDVINQYHVTLIGNDKAREEYLARRGLDVAAIVQFQIGYDERSGRYTIPVYDEHGDCVDVRRYKINTVGDEPKIISTKGYGGNRLFPIKHILDVQNKSESTVYITEGEHDAIMLWQHGYTSLTWTAGAAAWKNDWNDYFWGKDIVLIMDADDTGRKAADKVSRSLSGVARTIKRITLPSGIKDVTDYFKSGKTASDLNKIIDETKTEDEYQFVDLAGGIDAGNYKKKLKFYGVVVGKDLAPYQIPKTIRAECTGNRSGKTCQLCPFGVVSDCREIKFTYEYEKHAESLIRFINTGQNNIDGIIKRDMGLPLSSMCRKINIEILENQNVEDITIIPEVNYDKQDADYALRRAYYFDIGIQTNQSHVFYGTSLPDPTSQMSMYVVEKAKSTKDNISKFMLTEEIKAKLSLFQASDPTDPISVMERLNDIIHDLEDNVTHIFNRRPLHEAVLFCYHSPLSFNFLGERIQKGWLEAAVVGDTETGKSKTIQSLLRYFKLGEFITSGENSTVAGILGGLQQTHNKKWTVTWGKIPLNDRGLLVIDEADELAKLGIINLLSACRSEGVAELMKIQTTKTMARTRIIWVANPLHGTMASYNTGIETIVELFKTQQDIRRIDFVVGCGKDEVGIEEINTARTSHTPNVYTEDIMHWSILRAWNVKPDKIHFAASVESLILQKAIELGKTYSEEIPLILGSGARLKIARIAISIAMLTYSTKDGSDVIVNESHVLVAVQFIRDLYDNRVLNFSSYSHTKRHTMTISSPDSIDNLIHSKAVIDQLLSSNGLVIADIEDIFRTVDLQSAKTIVSTLRTNGCLSKSYQYYKKTPAFVRYLRERKEKL